MSRLHPARFVDLCLVYLGVAYVVTYALVASLGFDVVTVARVGVGLAFVLFGLARAVSGEESPDEYGLLTAFLGLVAVGFTALILVQLA